MEKWALKGFAVACVHEHYCVTRVLLHTRINFSQNSIVEKWALKGSNLRPSDYESDALTN